MTPLIAHVVFRLDYGGLENGVVNVVNGLDGQGAFRHAVIALTEATEFRRRLRPGIAVHAIGKRPGRDLGAYARLFRLLKALRPSVVHTRNFGTLDCAVVAALAGVPVRIHGEHGWDVADPDGTKVKYRIARRACAPFVHEFVTVSEHLRRWLAGTVGIREDKITRICNGVDTARFRAARPDEPRRLPQETFPEGALVVGSVTRFAAIKDPLNLIEAFIRARERLEGASRPLRLLMIGDGELRDAALRRLHAARAADDAWLPGSRDDVAELLRCMDVFVLGSLREGISNTVLEAMASGLPVIATETGGNPELIDSSETGTLVPPGDSDALANAIVAYASDEPLRTRHGAAARAAAVTRFSVDAMVGQYRSLYERALRGRVAVSGAGAVGAD
ncbi:MAG TPA: TIGR03088 family PEP-CTERM/XrtA system glycosyltransferase [Gammaproteobacteria bacterium]